MKKRIALGVIAALTGGLLATATPAMALDKPTGTGTSTLAWFVEAATTSSETTTATAATVTATQIAGANNFVQLKADTNTADTTVIVVSGSTITAFSDTTNASLSTDKTTLTYSAAGGTNGDTVNIAATTAGTVTAKVYTRAAAAGVVTDTLRQTFTITVIDKAKLDVASIKAFVRATNTCDATVTASNVTSSDLSATAYLCVQAFNGNAAAYTDGTATIAVVTNGISLVGGAAVKSETTTTGFKAFALTSNALTGSAKYSVTVTSTNGDATANSKTAEATLTVRGAAASIELANAKYSIATGAANLDNDVITITAKDKDNNAADLATNASGLTWYVSSDKDTDAPTSSAPIQAVSVTAVTYETATSVAADGTVTKGTVGITTTAAKYEQVQIWAVMGTVTSNKITVYVSSDATKTLSVAAVDGNVGATQTVKVTALTDAAVTGTAYPVADGESIALTANAGTVVTSPKTTSNGVAEFSFYNPLIGGPVTITATEAGSSSTGSKEIKVTAPASAAETANAAAISALQTSVAALQTTVASLVASITAQIKAINSALVKIARNLKVKL